MTIKEFMDNLLLGKPIEKTIFDQNEKVSDLFIIASNMLPCSSKNIVLAMCFAKGYGVKKDLNEFERLLLEALKYQDYRVYLWLINAYSGGVNIGGELIKLEDASDRKEYLIKESEPLIANYYNTSHGYKTVEELDELAAKKAERQKEQAALHKEIKERQSLLINKINEMSLDEIHSQIEFLHSKNALDIFFLSNVLASATYFNVDMEVIQYLFDLLIKENDGAQSQSHTKFFPISNLMSVGRYDMALELLILSEDEDCTFKTNAWVYYQEAVCYYHLKQYDKALQRLDLAMDDEDYIDLSYELEKKISKERKRG